MATHHFTRAIYSACEVRPIPIVMWRTGVLLTVCLLSACGGSSTQPTETTPPKLQAIAIDCTLVGTLPCQQPPPTQPTVPKPITSGTLRGTVTDGTSGGILPNIAMSVPSGRTITDATGHYLIADVPIGSVTLTASAVGYVTKNTPITVAGDLTVDLVLQRVPPLSTPTPPTPTQTPTHGGIRSDTITIPHELIVGSPIPTSTQGAQYCCWPFPVLHQGSYDYDLTQYPADSLPSGGSSNIVSASEMVFAGMRFGSATTKPATFSWHRAILGSDQQMFAYTVPLNSVAAYSFIGRFAWEVTLPGLYYVLIDTEWGTMTVDFIVTGPMPTFTKTSLLARPTSMSALPKGGAIPVR